MPNRMLSPVQIFSYYDQRQSYWANQQRDLSPACFVLPTNSDEVAKALKTLSQSQCRFALRSGGHSPNQGFNNMQAGVTFDLSELSGVTVGADRSFVNIKPGSRWCVDETPSVLSCANRTTGSMYTPAFSLKVSALQVDVSQLSVLAVSLPVVVCPSLAERRASSATMFSNSKLPLRMAVSSLPAQPRTPICTRHSRVDLATLVSSPVSRWSRLSSAGICGKYIP